MVNAISFGTAALTWFVGRTRISGRSIDDEARTLTLVKDGLFVAGAAAGLASMLSGLSLARQAPEGAVPIASGTTPAFQHAGRGGETSAPGKRAWEREHRDHRRHRRGDDDPLAEGGEVHPLERRGTFPAVEVHCSASCQEPQISSGVAPT